MPKIIAARPTGGKPAVSERRFLDANLASLPSPWFAFIPQAAFSREFRLPKETSC
jgi:hypothetical protein